jgi:hypothetical protein
MVARALLAPAPSTPPRDAGADAGPGSAAERGGRDSSAALRGFGEDGSALVEHGRAASSVSADGSAQDETDAAPSQEDGLQIEGSSRAAGTEGTSSHARGAGTAAMAESAPVARRPEAARGSGAGSRAESSAESTAATSAGSNAGQSAADASSVMPAGVAAAFNAARAGGDARDAAGSDATAPETTHAPRDPARIETRPDQARSAAHRPVELRFTTGDGAEGRLRVSVRGQAVRATIVAPDAPTARELERGMSDLQRALAERGFLRSEVIVRPRVSAGAAGAGERPDRAPRSGRASERAAEKAPANRDQLDGSSVFARIERRRER